ncbi:MAG TPA: hypothetical protein VM686_14985, partial [Polyangiaceae bacterium]|nr:hypothetical protein [Polyangiaceae bacterium]
MTKNRSPEKTHRLFRAMVLMSGGVALGCGGLSADQKEGTSSNDGKGGSAGSVSTGGSQSGGAAGESARGGSAGAIQLGGTGGTGGTVAVAGAGGTTTMEPPPCPPEQWDCSEAFVECDYSTTGYTLPLGCKCDDSRPLTSDACAANEWFVCRKARQTSSGEPLSEEDAIPFECTCVPEQQSCQIACQVAQPGGPYDPMCSQDAQSVLCG